MQNKLNKRWWEGSLKLIKLRQLNKKIMSKFNSTRKRFDLDKNLKMEYLDLLKTNKLLKNKKGCFLAKTKMKNLVDV